MEGKWKSLEQIRDEKMLEAYYEHYGLKQMFGFDIRPYLSLARFEGDERILREGDTVGCLYYLLEGRAKNFIYHENGRISLINFLKAPGFIGEMELIGARRKANGVTAVTPCLCFSIDIRACRDKLLQDSRFLLCLCRLLGERAVDNTGNYTKNQTYPLAVRTAEFILMTAVDGYYRERHTEAAEYLGGTYRNLMYVLAGFVKQGILRKTRAGYYIEKPEKLRAIAGMDKLL